MLQAIDIGTESIHSEGYNSVSSCQVTALDQVSYKSVKQGLTRWSNRVLGLYETPHPRLLPVLD